MPERIRQVLAHFSLSQKQFAELIGMKQSIISDWIGEKKAMPQSTAMAFQAALGVRWQWLLNGEGEMLLQKTEHIPDDLQRIVEILVRLSPVDRMKVAAFAEGFSLGKRGDKA